MRTSNIVADFERCLLIALPFSSLGALAAHWPILSFYTGCLLVFIVAVGLAVSTLTGINKPFLISAAFIPWIFIGCSTFVSVSLSQYAEASSWRWWLVFWVAGAALLIWLGEVDRLCGRKRVIFWLAVALWVTAIIHCALGIFKYYGFLQWIFPDMGPSPDQRISGILGQPNLTSDLAWLGMLSGNYLRLSGVLRRGAWLASLVVLCFVIIETASRASLIFATAFISLLLVYAWRSNERGSKRLSPALLEGGIVCIMLLLATLWAPRIDYWMTKTFYARGWIDRGLVDRHRNILANNGRLAEAEKIFIAWPKFSVKEKVVGWGPGNYALFSSRQEYVHPNKATIGLVWNNSHNIFTMFLVEQGLVGLVVLIFSCAIILRYVWRGPWTLEHLWVTSLLAVLFLHSNVEFPLWYLWFLAIFLALLYFLMPVKEVAVDGAAVRPLCGISLLAFTALMLFILISEYSDIQGAKVSTDKDFAYEQLVTLSGDGLLGPYATLVRYIELSPAKNGYARQISEVEKMNDWAPLVPVMERRAVLYALDKQWRKACLSSRQAAFRYPFLGSILQDKYALMKVSTERRKELDACIDEGLSFWGQDLQSRRAANVIDMWKMIYQQQQMLERRSSSSTSARLKN